MTSRERVLTAIAHKGPDRVPRLGFDALVCGITAIAYNRLKRFLGETGSQTVVYDLVQQLALPEPWFLRRFHVDAVDLGRVFSTSAQTRPWTLPDGSPAVVPAWFESESSNGEWLVRDKTGDVIGECRRALPASTSAIGRWPNRTVWMTMTGSPKKLCR